MATTTLAVSVPIELGNFLEENPDLSPSKILQSKLFEIKNEEARIQERLKGAETKCLRVMAKYQKLLDYCDSQSFAIPTDVLD